MARILVCDDDDDMIELCQRLFKMKGHELLVAQNGSDAVSTAEGRSKKEAEQKAAAAALEHFLSRSR